MTIAAISPSSPAADPVESLVSASDTVFFGILGRLEAQTMVPGQRLIETDLMAQFSVSRNSVREALQRLAAEGVVELLRHKGAAIRSLSLRETLDVIDVAERMTGLLARSAARGADAAAHTRTLQRIVRELEAADAARDVALFSTTRRRFYRTLLEMGGNLELKRLFPSIHMPIVHAQHRLPTLQTLRLADYRAIAKAVVAGDGDAADEAGAQHVRNVRQAILEESRQA